MERRRVLRWGLMILALAAIAVSVAALVGCSTSPITAAPITPTPKNVGPTALVGTPPISTATVALTTTSAAIPELLPAYYLNWKPNSATLRDAKGVVIVDYGGSIGKQYQPTTIAQTALAYYNRWLVDSNPTQAEADKTAFLTQINWLISYQTVDGRWLFTFGWGDQPVPWWSSMTEGIAMSALLRAYVMTGDPACLTAIMRARTTFERDLDHNGVGASVVVGSKSYVVYQEYLRGYEYNVLNGWIFSLVGLYEVENYLPYPEVPSDLSAHHTMTYLQYPGACLDLLGPDRGIAALKTLLPYYDTGTWSLYDLTDPDGWAIGGPSTVAYHKLVIVQLRYIAVISGDSFFSDYADRFQAELVACSTAGGCPPSD